MLLAPVTWALLIDPALYQSPISPPTKLVPLTLPDALTLLSRPVLPWKPIKPPAL